MEQERSKELLDETIFLPDFCGIRMVFTVVMVAELLAFAILLTTSIEHSLSWDKLGMLSLFIQWIALSSIAILCISRKWLVRLNDTLAGYLSYLIVLLVTLVVSEMAYRVMVYTGLMQDLNSHMDFVLRNLGISAILSAIILRVIYLQYQQKMHIQAHANARIQALQARIRPHFLFNSMNTIAALIRSQPENAEAAVEDLSDLFRASLDSGQQMVSLTDEVEIARRYIHIEQLRLGDRLTVTWDLDAIPDNAVLPVLTLQPLLENAIYHGIEKIPGGGEIRVLGECQGDWINIFITNPCLSPGMAGQSQGNKMAFRNIDERLQIAYGKQAGLKIVRETEHCQVNIVFPCQEK
ncbi:MAG: sensor histidine kinase [Gammaproteobacteria bacterium]|nr:sensor histidine kinase [Gammaproteobacteria bacterium]